MAGDATHALAHALANSDVLHDRATVEFRPNREPDRT